MADRLGDKHERIDKAEHGNCEDAGKDDADNNDQSSVKLLGFKACSHKSNLECMCLMGCRLVVRILVSSNWLGLGTGNDMSRHIRIQRNPTTRLRLARRSR